MGLLVFAQSYKNKSGYRMLLHVILIKKIIGDSFRLVRNLADFGYV